MNKVEELVNNWKENVSPSKNQYTDKQITEIAVHCLSLSKTWFDNNKPTEKESYEVRLYDNDGIVSEVLHGITLDNLPFTMMSIITNYNKKYSLLTLNSYNFSNGMKNNINELGKLEIS